MAQVNLSGMTIEELMDLHTQIEETLFKHRVEIKSQLERMDKAIAVVGSMKAARRGRSSLKGKKIPPKYRGPSGETWAGRGAKPRWLVAAIKGGKKIEDFLINKAVHKRWKKRRSKR